MLSIIIMFVPFYNINTGLEVNTEINAHSVCNFPMLNACYMIFRKYRIRLFSQKRCSQQNVHCATTCNIRYHIIPPKKGYLYQGKSVIVTQPCKYRPLGRKSTIVFHLSILGSYTSAVSRIRSSDFPPTNQILP